jgi:opacity protein-like surface antigen
MKKHILATSLAMVLASVSTASLAADTGNFYVGAEAGQAQYRLGAIPGEHLDAKDTAAAVRFGYVWHWAVDFGVEGGYVSLGKVTDDYTNSNGGYPSNTSVETSGLFAGAKVKYHFADTWYVSARAGTFQSHVKLRDHDGSPEGGNYRASSTNGSWYAGAGVGYELTPEFSLGLSYDNYRSKAGIDEFNTAMFALSAEYRF